MAIKSPLDELLSLPGAVGDVTRENTYGDTAPLPAERPEGTDRRVAQQFAQKQAQQRIRGAELARRDIPSFIDEKGEVKPVTDPTGAALTNYDARNNIAYDSTGEPKKLQYGETGAPKLTDPFGGLPIYTDEKTGDQYQRAPGLPWKHVGVDPVAADRAKILARDKENAAIAAQLGRKLTLDEHDFKEGTKQWEEERAALTTEIPGLTGISKKDEALAAVESHYNDLYSKNSQRTGWFGRGDYTEDAKAKRAQLDQDKAAAINRVSSFFDLSEKMRAKTDEIARTRETTQQIAEQRLNDRLRAAGVEIPETPAAAPVAPVARPIAEVKAEAKQPPTQESVAATFDKIEQAPMGAMERLSELFSNPDPSKLKSGYVELLPFASSGMDIGNLARVAIAAEKLKSGTETQEDLGLLKEFVDRNERDKTFGAKVIDVVAMLPAFAGELYATGGLYTLGAKAGTKAAQKGLAHLLEKSTKELINNRIAQFGAKAVGSTAGSLLQTIPAAGLRIASGTMERMLPQVKMTQTEAGELAAAITAEGDDLMPALMKATGDQFVEVWSERTGGALKFVPGAEKLKAIKLGLMQRWFNANPSAPPGAFTTFLKQAGWNGVVGEMFEERVGGVARGVGAAATTLIEGGPGKDAVTSFYNEAVPSLEQLAVEGVAFAIPGAATTGYGIYRNRQFRQKVTDSATAYQQADHGIANAITVLDDPNSTPEEKKIAAKLAADMDATHSGAAMFLVGQHRDVVNETLDTLEIEDPQSREVANEFINTPGSHLFAAQTLGADLIGSGTLAQEAQFLDTQLAENGVDLPEQRTAMVNHILGSVALAQTISEVTQGLPATNKEALALLTQYGVVTKTATPDGTRTYELDARAIKMLPPAIGEEIVKNLSKYKISNRLERAPLAGLRTMLDPGRENIRRAAAALAPWEPPGPDQFQDDEEQPPAPGGEPQPPAPGGEQPPAPEPPAPQPPAPEPEPPAPKPEPPAPEPEPPKPKEEPEPPAPAPPKGPEPTPEPPEPTPQPQPEPPTQEPPAPKPEPPAPQPEPPAPKPPGEQEPPAPQPPAPEPPQPPAPGGQPQPPPTGGTPTGERTPIDDLDDMFGVRVPPPQGVAAPSIAPLDSIVPAIRIGGPKGPLVEGRKGDAHMDILNRWVEGKTDAEVGRAFDNFATPENPNFFRGGGRDISREQLQAAYGVRDAQGLRELQAKAAASTVDAEAHRAATSRQNNLPQPTTAQKKAGVYAKGHVNLGGLKLSIENPEGTQRKPGWKKLVSHYGYIRGSKGKDKDHIDVFIRKGTPTDYHGPVFVVNQMNADGTFDEHKAVIGVATAAEALAEYNANYEAGWNRAGSVAEFKTMDAFRKWATGAVRRTAEAKGSALHPGGASTPEQIQGVQATGAAPQPAPDFNAPENIAKLIKAANFLIAQGNKTPEAFTKALLAGMKRNADKVDAGLLNKLWSFAQDTDATLPDAGRADFQKILDALRKPTLRYITQAMADRGWTERESPITSYDTRWIALKPNATGNSHVISIDEKWTFPYRVQARGYIPHRLVKGVDYNEEGESLSPTYGFKDIEEAALYVESYGPFYKNPDGKPDEEEKPTPPAPPTEEPTPPTQEPPAPPTEQPQPPAPEPPKPEEPGQFPGPVEKISDEAAWRKILEDEFDAQLADYRKMGARLGFTVEEPPAGAHIGYFDRSTPEKFFLSKKGIVDAAMDYDHGKSWIQFAFSEELIHMLEFWASGKNSDQYDRNAEAIFQEMMRLNPMEAQVVYERYNGRESHAYMGHEYLRMVLQSKLSNGFTDLYRTPYGGGSAMVNVLKKILAWMKRLFEGGELKRQFMLEEKIAQIRDIVTLGNTLNPDNIEGTKPTTAEEFAELIKDRLIANHKISRKEMRDFASKTGLSEKQIDEWTETGIVRAAQIIAHHALLTPMERYERLVALYGNQPNLSEKTGQSRELQAYSTPVPLGYFAGRLAGIAGVDHIGEPTAGNGALLIEADPRKLVRVNEIDPERAKRLRYLGFDPKIRNVLQFPFRIFDLKDLEALVLNPPFGSEKENGVPTGRKFSVRIGGSTSTQGYNFSTTRIDYYIALKSLEDGLRDNGRAVLIIGGVKEDMKDRTEGYKNAAAIDFFTTLSQTYKIADHFTVSGSLYEKQGAGWPVDVIVIEGRGVSKKYKLPSAIAPRMIKAWSELGALLNAHENPPKSSKSPSPGDKRGPDGGDSGPPVAPTPKRPDDDTDEGGGGGGSSGKGGTPPTDNPEPPKPPTEGGPAEPGDDTAGGSGNLPRRDGGTGGDLVGSEHQVPYVPASKAKEPDGMLTPTNLAEPEQDALERLREEVGDIDQFVAEKLGFGEEYPAAMVGAAYQQFANEDGRALSEMKPDEIKAGDVLINRADKTIRIVSATGETAGDRFVTSTRYVMSTDGTTLAEYVRDETSLFTAMQENGWERLPGRLGAKAALAEHLMAEQVDAIALAIWNHERGYAMIIGDQTGIGKGRVAAGLMRYAIRNDMVPVFCTAKDGLYMDMLRDLNGVGFYDKKDPFRDIRPIFTQNNFNDDSGTPNTLEDLHGNKWKLKPANQKRMIQHIIDKGEMPDWQTENGETTKQKANAIFTTYSQIQGAAGAVRADALKAIGPKAFLILDESHQGAGDSSRRARLSEIQDVAKGAYYSSATYCKRSEAIALYTRTSISATGIPVEDLIRIMEHGKQPLQQVVASMLAIDGCYMRRERDFRGIKFRTKVTTDEAEKAREFDMAHNFIELSRGVLEVDRLMGTGLRSLTKTMAEAGIEFRESPQSRPQRSRMQSRNPFANNFYILSQQYTMAMKAKAVVAETIDRVTKGGPPLTDKEKERQAALEAKKTLNREEKVELQTLIDSQKPQQVVVQLNFTNESPLEQIAEGNMELTFNSLLKRYLRNVGQVKLALPGAVAHVLIGRLRAKEAAGTITPEERAHLVSLTPNGDYAGNQIRWNMLEDPFPEIAIDAMVIMNASPMAIAAVKASAEAVKHQVRSQFIKVVDSIDKTDLGDMPLSPIDYIRDALAERGIESGDYTGRSLMVKEGKLIPKKDDDAKGKKQLEKMFQSGKIPVLILNSSGSTGISLHSSAKEATNHAQRVMILAQPSAEINEFMQTLGRINRTGQVNKPEYVFLRSSLPAEQRLAIFLMRKMSLLNANTTSATDSDITAEMDVADLFNQFGDTAIARWLRANAPDAIENMFWKFDRYRYDGDGNLRTPLEQVEAFIVGEGAEEGDLTRVVTGAMSAVDPEFAQEFYEVVTEEYRSLIASATAAGENPFVAEAFDYQARTISTATLFEGAKSGSIFAEDANLERVEIQNVKEPVTPTEAAEMAKDASGGMFLPHGIPGRRSELPDVPRPAMPAATTSGGTVRQTGRYRPSRWQRYSDAIDAELRQQLDNRRNSEEFTNEKDGAQRWEAWKTGREAHWQNIRLRARAQAERIGERVIVDVGGIMTMGVIIDVRLNERKPGALSGSDMVIAVNTSSRKGLVTVPLSQSAERVHNYQAKAAEFQFRGHFETDWERTKRVLRHRYIITGNLLGGYRALQERDMLQGAAVITYTKDDGTTATGIQMPEKFAGFPEAVIRDGAALIQYVIMNRRVATISPIEGIIVNYYGRLRLMAPATNKGNPITQNSTLRDLAGTDFTGMRYNGKKYLGVDIDPDKAFPLMEELARLDQRVRAPEINQGNTADVHAVRADRETLQAAAATPDELPAEHRRDATDPIQGVNTFIGAKIGDSFETAEDAFDEEAAIGEMPVVVSAKPTAAFKGRAISRPDAIEAMLRIFRAAGRDVRARVGRIQGKRDTTGVWKDFPEIIRTRRANDIGVAAHEVGHGMQKVLYSSIKASALKTLPKAVKAELLKLGRALYGAQRPHTSYTTEGFAEFIRIYLTQDNAAVIAPATHDYLLNTVLPMFPQVNEAFAAAKGVIDQYRAQGSVNAGRANIVNPADWRHRLDKWKRMFRKGELIRNWIDEVEPFRQLVAHLRVRHGVDLPIEEDPAKIYSVRRGQAPGIAAYMAKTKMIDFAGNPVSGSLRDALAPVEERMGDFGLFLYAHRAIERWDHTIEKVLPDGTVELVPDPKDPGISREMAVEIRDQLGADPKFQIAAEAVWEWNKGLMNYVRQASPSIAPTIDRIMKGSEKYIPLMRWFNPDEIRTLEEGKTGSSLHRMIGSGRQILEPFPVMLQQAQRLIELAHKRQILDAALAIGQKHGGLGFQIEEVPKARVKNNLRLGDIAKQLEELGLDLTGLDQDEILTFFSPMLSPKGRDPILAHVVNGKTKWYFIDPRLFDAMEGVNLYRLPKAFDILLGAPARLFRLGTTGLRASFGLFTNPARDLPTFLMQTQSNANPARMLEMYVRSLGRLADPRRMAGRKDAWTDLFERTGVQVGQPLGTDIALATQAHTELHHGMLRRIVTHPIDMMRELFSIPEAAPRIAEMRLIAEEVGWDGEAPLTQSQMLSMALAAKQVTLDFAAAGAIGKKVNQAIPFFNATIRGTVQAWDAYQRNPLRFVLRGLTWTTIPALMLWLINQDDDWYDDLPWRDKYLYFNIRFGNKIIQIPRSPEYGNYFGVVPEAILDSWKKRDPEGAKQAARHLVATHNPADLPPAFRMAKEQLENRIAFFDRPIVPKSEEDLLPGEQRGPYTSDLAKTLGDLFPESMSPRRIDAAIRSLTGGAFSDFIVGSENVMKALGVWEKERDFTASDLPVIGRAFRRGGIESSASLAVSNFYDQWEKAEQRQRSILQPETALDRRRRLQLDDAKKAIQVLTVARQAAKTEAQQATLNRRIREIATEAVRQAPPASEPPRRSYAEASSKRPPKLTGPVARPQPYKSITDQAKKRAGGADVMFNGF